MLSDRTIFLIVSILLSLLTLGYVILIWLASSMVSILLEPDNHTWLTKLAIAPITDNVWLGAIHWQSLAVLSFLVNIIWARKRCQLMGYENGYTAPLCCHLLLVLLLIVWHAAGALDPLIMIGSVLG